MGEIEEGKKEMKKARKRNLSMAYPLGQPLDSLFRPPSRLSFLSPTPLLLVFVFSYPFSFTSSPVGGDYRYIFSLPFRYIVISLSPRLSMDAREAGHS